MFPPPVIDKIRCVSWLPLDLCELQMVADDTEL